jgi:hypothetical protein
MPCPRARCSASPCPSVRSSACCGRGSSCPASTRRPCARCPGRPGRWSGWGRSWRRGGSCAGASTPRGPSIPRPWSRWRASSSGWWPASSGGHPRSRSSPTGPAPGSRPSRPSIRSTGVSTCAMPCASATVWPSCCAPATARSSRPARAALSVPWRGASPSFSASGPCWPRCPGRGRARPKSSSPSRSRCSTPWGGSGPRAARSTGRGFRRAGASGGCRSPPILSSACATGWTCPGTRGSWRPVRSSRNRRTSRAPPPNPPNPLISSLSPPGVRGTAAPASAFLTRPRAPGPSGVSPASGRRCWASTV